MRGSEISNISLKNTKDDRYQAVGEDEGSVGVQGHLNTNIR